jgi:hypothetical protein
MLFLHVSHPRRTERQLCFELLISTIFVRMIQLSKSASTSTTAAKDDTKTKKSAALLSKSNVLRLLAELSRSYSCCASLICQHTYYAGQSELVKEVMMA